MLYTVQHTDAGLVHCCDGQMFHGFTAFCVILSMQIATILCLNCLKFINNTNGIYK